MTLIYILLVLLIVTRAFGELAERLGQPALLGELVSGICLGLLVHNHNSTFPVLAGLTDNEVFVAITDLGIFFLMLLGGIELNPHKLAKSAGGSFLVAAGGMIIPLALGMAFGWYILPDSEYRLAQALFLGTALSVTAVPVSIKTLMDLGKLESRVGQIIVSAAVIDDTLSLVLLAALTAIINTGSIPDLASLAALSGKVALFFLIAGGVGHFIFPRIGRLLKKCRAEELEFSMLLIAALGYAMLAEALEMHFILGAFMAGLYFRRRTINPKVYASILTKTKGLTAGFLAPIFFASIGLHLDLEALAIIPGTVVLLIVVATFGKVFGAGIAATAAGLSLRQSLAIGAGMNARGAVELVIADIALRAGLFSLPEPAPDVIRYLFSAVVIMAVVTTLMTPPALKLTLGYK